MGEDREDDGMRYRSMTRYSVGWPKPEVLARLAVHPAEWARWTRHNAWTAFLLSPVYVPLCTIAGGVIGLLLAIPMVAAIKALAVWVLAS
jgi:hypothetical protein